MEGDKKKKSPEKRQKNGTRDEKGRFVKGNCANPGGRPKVPEELRVYGRQAPDRLRAIADDPNTPVKVKADIEKWFAEMTYGKALQQVDMDASVENTTPMTITFQGALDEWSR